MKSFIDITDFSREGLREVLNQMTYIKDNQNAYGEDLVRRNIVTALHGEDKLCECAFSSAVTRMGGNVLKYKLKEGETLREFAKTMSAFGDAIVLSHPKMGAARAASLYSSVPVINAGDGGRAYPVRTLADFSSVWIEKKHVSNMKIGFLGDFTDNALVKNLLQCLNIYNGNEFCFISVNGKPLPEEYISIMDRREKAYSVYDNLFEALPDLDVLYMTRVTPGNFESRITYEARKHNFTIDERKLMVAKPDLVILHPLPRGEELDASVDDDKRSAYFAGLDRYVDACMVMLSKTVKGKASRRIEPDFEEPTHQEWCGKECCITSCEDYLPPLFYELADGTLICKYCGQELKK